MPFATVSSKGQITLPAASRRRLGIKARDRVAIEVVDDAIVIRPVPDFFDLEGFLGKALPAEEERRRMADGVAEHEAGEP
jgi:AbrB family looped-hinge helix DNA binding protein